MSTHAPLPVTLRSMRNADMPALANMWVESWREVFPDIDFETRRAWFHDRMAAHSAAGVRIWIAHNASALQGFITVDTASQFIDQLAVARAALGRGVAQALIAEARHLSPRRLLLDVNEANTRAVRFYQRQGFAVTGRGISEASGLALLRMLWLGKEPSHGV